MRVAEQLGAPVVTGVFGRGAISTGIRSRWATLGRLNLYDELLTQADLVLVVGSRIDVVSTGAAARGFPSGSCRWISIHSWSGSRPWRWASSATRRWCSVSTAQLGVGQTRACWFDAAGPATANKPR